MKKASEIWEGPNSSLHKTYNEAVRRGENEKEKVREEVLKEVENALAEKKWDIETKTGIITGLSMPKIREIIQFLNIKEYDDDFTAPPNTS